MPAVHSDDCSLSVTRCCISGRTSFTEPCPGAWGIAGLLFEPQDFAGRCGHSWGQRSGCWSRRALVLAAVLGQESRAVAFRAGGQRGALPGCSACELGHSSWLWPWCVLGSPNMWTAWHLTLGSLGTKGPGQVPWMQPQAPSSSQARRVVGQSWIPLLCWEVWPRVAGASEAAHLLVL